MRKLESRFLVTGMTTVAAVFCVSVLRNRKRSVLAKAVAFVLLLPLALPFVLAIIAVIPRVERMIPPFN